MNTALLPLAGLTLGLAGLTAHAAVITVDMDVDLNDITTNASQVTWANSAKTPAFNFGAGDTVVLNYNFIGGQAMHLTNGSGIANTNLNFFTMRTNQTAVGVVTFDNASITLNGLSGTGLSNSFDYYSNNGIADGNGLLSAQQHGYYLYTVDALLDGADLAFTGFTVEFTHVSGGTAGPWFSYFWINDLDTASDYETGPASSFGSSSVPVPGAALLMGLGLVSLRLRRAGAI